MVANHHKARRRSKSGFSPFLQNLRLSFSHHITYDELWGLLLGDKIPVKYQQQTLLTHFKSHGWNVTPRDFVRGTAASNHPVFIGLRMLRHTLSRFELDALFFNDNRHNNRKE